MIHDVCVVSCLTTIDLLLTLCFCVKAHQEAWNNLDVTRNQLNQKEARLTKLNERTAHLKKENDELFSLVKEQDDILGKLLRDVILF